MVADRAAALSGPAIPPALAMSRLPASPASPWRQHALEFTIPVALLTAFQFIMPASEATAGSAGAKLFLVLRMTALVLLCTWMLRRHGETWRDVGLRQPRRWWMVPVLVVLGFVSVVVISSMMYQVILPAIGAPVPDLKRGRLVSGDLGEYLFAAIPVAWGTAAFGEELVVRGFLLDRLIKVLRPSAPARASEPAYSFGSPEPPGTPVALVAIVLQAGLFGTLHFYQGIGGILLTAVVGLLFGFLWLAGRRNLWAGILLHGIVDFIAATESYLRAPGS